MPRPLTPPLPSIPEHLSIAVVLVDADLRVCYLNPAAEMMFAVSARQLEGQPMRVLTGSMEQLEASIRGTLASGVGYTERERKLLTHAQQPLTVDITVSALPGPFALLELVQLDRHLRISREQQAIAQHRALRELVRGLAHEIKNPLGGLRGAAQLLERELPSAALREYTQVIIDEADRLQKLVDALLGPNGRPQRRLINLHEVLERVRQLVQAEAPAGVELMRDYDPSLPSLIAEPDQLIQAVLNIVRNALQAIGDHGRILLRTRAQRQFTIGEQVHKLVARIDVIDDGPGIPPALMEQIFFPMVSTRPEGSGLGLPIAQTLVNRHGGMIACVSEPGQTVFTLWLPLEESHD